MCHDIMLMFIKHDTMLCYVIGIVTVHVMNYMLCGDPELFYPTDMYQQTLSLIIPHKQIQVNSHALVVIPLVVGGIVILVIIINLIVWSSFYYLVVFSFLNKKECSTC